MGSDRNSNIQTVRGFFLQKTAEPESITSKVRPNILKLLLQQYFYFEMV